MGLLTDPACDGSNEALNSVAIENAIDAALSDPARVLLDRMWMQRDLDRLQFDGTWGSRY
jgi:hypothetical protein